MSIVGRSHPDDELHINPRALGEQVIKITLPDTDPVQRPAHYNRGRITPFDVIDDWGLDYYSGNAVKYVCRAGHKTPDAIEDLQKAIRHLEHEIKRLKSVRVTVLDAMKNEEKI